MYTPNLQNKQKQKRPERPLEYTMLHRFYRNRRTHGQTNVLHCRVQVTPTSPTYRARLTNSVSKYNLNWQNSLVHTRLVTLTNLCRRPSPYWIKKVYDVTKNVLTDFQNIMKLARYLRSSQRHVTLRHSRSVVPP